MRKILALMLTVIMIVGIFALPVAAEESVTVLDENFGKVKVTGKVQSDGSIAFGVRSSFGDSETKDIIQYFVSPRGEETTYGMENHQAFDFYSYQEPVDKKNQQYSEAEQRVAETKELLFLFQVLAGLVQVMV